MSLSVFNPIFILVVKTFNVTLFKGDRMDFLQRSIHDLQDRNTYIVELQELEALASALDTQKELAERAFFIHREATRNSPHMHDAEVSYLFKTNKENIYIINILYKHRPKQKYYITEIQKTF